MPSCVLIYRTNTLSYPILILFFVSLFFHMRSIPIRKSSVFWNSFFIPLFIYPHTLSFHFTQSAQSTWWCLTCHPKSRTFSTNNPPLAKTAPEKKWLLSRALITCVQGLQSMRRLSPPAVTPWMQFCTTVTSPFISHRRKNVRTLLLKRTRHSKITPPWCGTYWTFSSRRDSYLRCLEMKVRLLPFFCSVRIFSSPFFSFLFLLFFVPSLIIFLHCTPLDTSLLQSWSWSHPSWTFT